MAYDFLTLAATLKDLEQTVLLAKINKIHQPDKWSIVLRYYGRKGQGKLLLSAAADAARIQLTEGSPENPAKPPLFSMVLRKWLEGATLKAVSQTPYERVATLTFATHNEVGDAVTLRLIIEIMGKHSNIILVDEAGLILDGIRRYDSRLSRYREVLPGLPYLPPPPQERALPPLTEEQLAALLLEEELDLLAERALSKRVGGLSPQLAREMLTASGLDPLITLDELGEREFNLLSQTINALAKRYEQQDFQPTLLLAEGQPQDFAAYAPLGWSGQTQPFATMSAAIDAYYAALNQAKQLAAARRKLQKPLQQHLQRLQRKIGLQRDDLAASLRGDRYKQAGDLLAAHLYVVQQQAGSSGRGLEQVSLPSFEDPQQMVEIKLDAALTPQQNVQRFYHLYNKSRKAHEAIRRFLAENEAELEYLESAAQSLEMAATLQELAEIERELRSGGYLPQPAPDRKGKKPQSAKSGPPALPPRRYRSADGFLILVGRNNKQNERLTLRIAGAQDIWLHTQKIPGSHVIIVTEGKPVPDTTLTEAAAYAAWFSQAKESPKVPVDYTLASQVKKPQGARPGMVNYFQQQTVYVAPRDPGAEEAAPQDGSEE